MLLTDIKNENRMKTLEFRVFTMIILSKIFEKINPLKFIILCSYVKKDNLKKRRKTFFWICIFALQLQFTHSVRGKT